MDITALVCSDDRSTQIQRSQEQTQHPQQLHQLLPAVSSLSAAASSHSASSSLDSLPSSITSLTSLPPIFVPPQQPGLHQAQQYLPYPSIQPLHHAYYHPIQSSSQAVEPRQPQQTDRPQSSQQRVECGLCGKSFSGISSHNRHVSRTHHKARPFACSQCNLQFGQKGSLDRHTAAVHLKERPFTCEHCHKGFGRKDNMKIHMTTVHLKKKPYKCDMCPKSFGGKRPLKIHRQTVHFKQRPLQCEFCDKRFGQRSNLNVHMKVHKRADTAGPTVPQQTAMMACSPPTSPIGSMDDLSSIRTDGIAPGANVDAFPSPYPEIRCLISSPI